MAKTVRRAIRTKFRPCKGTRRNIKKGTRVKIKVQIRREAQVAD